MEFFANLSFQLSSILCRRKNMSLVLRIAFIFSLIIHLIFRSVNLVTELLLCVNNFGIGETLYDIDSFIKKDGKVGIAQKKRGILFCSVLWGCLAAVVSTIMPAVAAIVSTIMPAVMSSVVSAVMPVAAVMSSMVVSVC